MPEISLLKHGYKRGASKVTSEVDRGDGGGERLESGSRVLGCRLVEGKRRVLGCEVYGVSVHQERSASDS